ncbi:tetratricopeptide repeat protein [Streptomyces glaucescens]|uniref:tetratricopeptide repeat protein n=1 Tax=Streptomyces glaucescens TaxID=1907 RepID=UPI003F5508C8
MSGARSHERGSRSRGELIRRRARARFVGRRAQLSLFVRNLAKDPEDEVSPAEFLFHVRGVGGVGKSTLLREWQERARAAGAVSAVVDEGDVHGVEQALVEVARQLAEQAGPLKEFDRAAEQHRKEQEAAVEPGPMEGGPDAVAQGGDRSRSGVRARGRRGRGGDESRVRRAFVTELGKLCERYEWVVLFFDTWERTGRYLDGWLRALLEDEYGPLPTNVMVVLAGRDQLAEREWGPLRAQVVDVPLEVFTEAETRALLAARDVTAPDVVDAVFQLSMGLPLLVDLLAHARPGAAEDVDPDGDVVDAAVERFVQWVTDARQREAVLACALAPHLNKEVFDAAAPEDARELWEWLCRQPFVSGHGGFKQYHAVVRASMVRRQRTHSPQHWMAAHLRLADTHAAWRAAAAHGLSEEKRWSDARWLRHHVDETYHRLCAQPTASLGRALEQAVHAAGQDTAALRQWVGNLELAARDTAEPTLVSWAGRLRTAVASADPALECLTALLSHGPLDLTTRAWCHTYRGRRLYHLNRNEEAIAELDRAVAADPRNVRGWVYRGEAHRWLNHLTQALADYTTALALSPDDAFLLAKRGETYCADERYDEAMADLTGALELDPALAWALVARGETHRMAGRYDEAVTDLTAAITLDSSYTWCMTARGQAHRQAGRYDEAITDLTAAIHLDPTDAWAFAQRGEAHREAGRYDEAITDLTAALQLDPTDAWALCGRGEAHRQAGRYDQAITDLTAAIERDSTLAWAFGCRGEAHRQAGRYDQAVTDLTAAIERDPAYAWALAKRGEAHRQAGRYDEAITDLTAALQLDPAYAWAFGSRGEAHLQAGRYDEAVTDLTAAIERDPAYAWALAKRGEVHRQAGRYDEAVTDLTAALELNPTQAWVLGTRGQTHRQAGRYDEAVTDLTAAVHLDPAYAWALAERGEAHFQAGRYDEAVTDLTAAVQLDPGYFSALGNRGEAHRQAGRYDEAVTDLTAALELDPTSAWARTLRGEAHRQAGRYDDAVTDLTAALELDPANTWAHALRGEAHRQAGRYDEAITDLTAALELDPANTWAIGLRGTARRQAGDLPGAREDLERVASSPDTSTFLFEKLILDTVETGAAACAEQWTDLFASPPEALDDNVSRFLPLFRALLVDHDVDIAVATEVFLTATPEHDAVTDLRHYLVEFSALGGEPADRAQRCRRLVDDWQRPGADTEP